MSQAILQEISEKLQQGKTKDIKVLVPQALEEGVPAKDILNDGLLAGMSIVGDALFETGIGQRIGTSLARLPFAKSERIF